MTLFLEFREKLRKLYADYSYIALPVGKFLLALIVFIGINHTIGYKSLLNNVFVVLILSLICCLLPTVAITVCAAILILGHCYSLGIEVAGIALLLLVILGIFLLRFGKNNSLALILTPLSFGVGMPCLIPICFGLKKKPISAIPIACGTIVYYFLKLIQEKSSVLQGGGQSEMSTRIKLILDGVIKDQTMLLNLVAGIIVLLLVYAVRRTGMDHAHGIAIGVGTVVYLAVMISGALFMDIQTSMIVIVAGAIASGIVAYIAHMFILSLDYTRTEHIEFEDDEYYYYVKAVPKMTITTAQRQIKTISDDDDALFGENREKTDIDEDDLEKKLEESLKNL